jgi:hypothetical protein
MIKWDLDPKIHRCSTTLFSESPTDVDEKTCTSRVKFVASTIATALTQFLNIVLQQEGKIPKLARKMDATALNQQLTVAQVQLAAVEVQLIAVESGLFEPDADKVYLRKKEDQLREEKRQLREEKRQLRELILRQSPGK